MKRLLLTGGGSGGHVFPLIAVAKKIQESATSQKIDIILRYYGPKDIYADYLLKENIPVYNIWKSKLHRVSLWRNIFTLPKFVFSFFQALIKILFFMPDLVFSKGGPGALPILYACRFYKIPVIIHESDSVPGLTNQLTGKFAQKIELAFPSAEKYFPQKNTRVVGNPIREEIISAISLDPAGAKERLGLPVETPLILVLGGSLGSTRVNQLILNNLEELLSRYQIFHQTGTANFDNHKNELKKIGKKLPRDYLDRYQIFAFFEKNLKDIYAASDLIISRAGAGLIFEIAALGKPAILIPYPEAANGHQKQNAYEYAQTDAAIVIEEKDFGSINLNETIEKLLGNPAQINKIRAAAQSFAKPDAARQIAADIVSFLSSPRKRGSNLT